MTTVNPQNFALYEKRDDDESYSSIGGMLGKEPNTIHCWKGMNEFDEDAVTIPDGYTRVDNLHDDWIKRYFYNPNLKYVEPRKVPEYDQKHYFIHDNGDRPFVVYLDGSVATVYRQPNHNENYYVRKENDPFCRELYHHKVGEYKYEKAFIGESPLNSMTEWSDGHGDDFLGNSILLHLNGLQYLHISESIKKFTAFAPIVRYEASVGNSDVPYPYCEDSDGYLYMMLEDVCINKPDTVLHPYEWYYMNDKILANDCVNFEDKSFGGYKGFYIDGEPYSMSWHSDAGKHYDGLLRFDEESEKDSELELMKEDGTLELCTKDMYVNLNDAFARQRGYRCLDVEIVHPRVWN